VAHFSRLSKIVVDVPGETHDAEVAFWREALGITLTRSKRFPEYHVAELAGGIGMLTQQLGHGAPRYHLDIHTNDRAAEVARLQRLGATLVEELELWSIMRDPAGLTFCVVADPSVDATNATEW
jgi:predicted enzyme related to lactoylglutathione lyase